MGEHSRIKWVRIPPPDDDEYITTWWPALLYDDHKEVLRNASSDTFTSATILVQLEELPEPTTPQSRMAFLLGSRIPQDKRVLYIEDVKNEENVRGFYWYYYEYRDKGNQDLEEALVQARARLQGEISQKKMSPKRSQPSGPLPLVTPVSKRTSVEPITAEDRNRRHQHEHLTSASTKSNSSKKSVKLPPKVKGRNTAAGATTQDVAEQYVQGLLSSIPSDSGSDHGICDQSTKSHGSAMSQFDAIENVPEGKSPDLVQTQTPINRTNRTTSESLKNEIHPEDSWNTVWKIMRSNGWKWADGDLYCSYYYLPPGGKKPSRKNTDVVRGVDYFSSEEAVMEYARKTYNWRGKSAKEKRYEKLLP